MHTHTYIVCMYVCMYVLVCMSIKRNKYLYCMYAHMYMHAHTYIVCVYFRNWLGRLSQDFILAFDEHSSQTQKNKEKDKEEYVRSGTYASRTQSVQNGTYIIFKAEK